MTLEQAFEESLSVISTGLFSKVKRAFAEPLPRDIRAIKSSLLANEDVSFAAKIDLGDTHDKIGGLMGILIITNLRVLYYYGPNKDNWTLDQIPVDTIESIEFSRSYIESIEFSRSYTSSYLSVYGKSSIFHLNSDRHVLMEKARDLINQMIYDKSQNSESSESESSVSDDMAQAAEALKSLKELLDSGIITQEEFDAKKKQLLGL